MEHIIHCTKKDFRVDWYSGSGAGGQHRNKHQNCCRITHIESGLVSRGTASRSRVSNQRDAFRSLSEKVITWFLTKEVEEKSRNDEVIRNYNGFRNEVHDKASGLKMPYSEIVVSGNIDPMITARREAVLVNQAANSNSI